MKKINTHLSLIFITIVLLSLYSCMVGSGVNPYIKFFQENDNLTYDKALSRFGSYTSYDEW
jgi:hypothetical protein